MKIRVLAAATVVAALAVLSPSPASASVSTPYAVDDVDNVAQPRGDITSVRVHLAPQKVVWTITLRRAVSLVGNFWKVPAATAIDIPMDTQDGGAVDFIVQVRPGPFGAVGNIIDVRPDSMAVCPAPALDQPGDLRTIRVRMSRSCLDSPMELRGQVRYRFDAGPDGDVDSIDRSPDNGFTPQVRLR